MEAEARVVQAIVFDFDGVIVEASESVIKEQAWEGVAETFGFGEAGRTARLEAQARYAKGRGTRVDILRDTFLTLRHPPAEIEDLVRRGSERFNELVQAGIKELGVEEEDHDALWMLATRLPLFINTGTPEDAIIQTISNLDLTAFFNGVYGMPSGKVANLERARIAADCRPSEIVFVGDGSHDFEAAQQFGCAFLGRANSHNGWKEPMPFPLIRSLNEIFDHIA